MEELINYIDNPNYIFKEEELQKLEINLKDNNYANSFIQYLKQNYYYFNNNYIDKITTFLKRLTELNESSSWQIAIRIFCNNLYTKLFSALIEITVGIVPKKDEPFIQVQEKINNTCQEIILSPINNSLNQEEEKLLLEIIKKHAIFYTLPGDSFYEKAIARLTELKISKNELTKITKIKKEQLENLKPKETKKRT